MARTLNSPVADQRAEMVYLYEIEHSGGTLRLTNASADITALTFTWTAVGGALAHGAAAESPDRRSQGMSLELYGVDQTITQQVQNNQFRGYPITIYILFYDPTTGVQDTPDIIFRGRQNADYTGKETREFDNQETGGTSTLATRISADLASINARVSVRCNVHNHEEMLRRSGVVAPDDKFFSRVASLMDKEIFWGTVNPELVRVRGNDGPVDMGYGNQW